MKEEERTELKQFCDKMEITMIGNCITVGNYAVQKTPDEGFISFKQRLFSTFINYISEKIKNHESEIENKIMIKSPIATKALKAYFHKDTVFLEKAETIEEKIKVLKDICDLFESFIIDKRLIRQIKSLHNFTKKKNNNIVYETDEEQRAIQCSVASINDKLPRLTQSELDEIMKICNS